EQVECRAWRFLSATSRRPLAPSYIRLPPRNATLRMRAYIPAHRLLRGMSRVSSGAEVLVVDVALDRRVLAAGGALGVATQLQRPEGHSQRVVREQSADEGIPLPEDELDRLGSLQRADDAAQDPEHARLGARRREVGRRRLRIEAAVAGTDERLERRHLAVEAENRAMHHRDAVEQRGVVHEVVRREVVAAVDDDVPARAEDSVDVAAVQALLILDHLHVG